MPKPGSEITLDTPTANLPGIGPKKSAALRHAGISTVLDLLRITPARYQNRSKVVFFAQAKPDGSAQGLFKAKLLSCKSFHARRGLTIISAEFADQSSQLTARWFNKTYLTRQLKEGDEYWLFGQVIAKGGKSVLSNPEIEPVQNEKNATSGLTPVYPARQALSDARVSPLVLRKLIGEIIGKINWHKSFPEFSESSPFKAIAEALVKVHQPVSEEQASQAGFTLAFFDQLLFQMGVLKRREAITGFLAIPDQKIAPDYLISEKLPFELTNSQKKVLNEIVDDIKPESGKPPMNRLVQGDVGCGKTLVAFLAMLELRRLVPSAQIAFMAPTEVLARQHLISFQRFFPDQANQAAILTGSQKKAERKTIETGLAAGRFAFVFGTHALFQENIGFSHLALCIIDEQQRFGVDHRRRLFRKGDNPHQLLLSATPIPRTLSLTIFGDMDTSIIDELPPGRSPVKTVLADRLHNTLPEIRQTLAADNKVYLVCPLIEVSEKTDWKSVEEAADELSDLLPEAEIACLTGQQSWDEKELIMNRFKAGQIDILVATTVIEVGVDHADATLMIIENADRFGLSQLHQLRGRVGRSTKASTCILVSHQETESERLNLLVSSNDGFYLSMEDLKIRGPGDLVGTRQSGLSHPCFSHRISQKMIENARKRAFEILTIEPQLTRDWFMRQMEASFGDSYKTFMEGG
ncbi:MAG: ATP-dependent DNA helicase RecG [Candidatus Riflebacteria bacterium]